MALRRISPRRLPDNRLTTAEIDAIADWLVAIPFARRRLSLRSLAPLADSWQ
jgi:hypothetical protein